MNGATTYTHQFVEFIPDELQAGVLYISREYATAAHKCMCGCGSRIVTPLAEASAPKRWVMSFDGATVSLHPSIGNWSYPCQSHYWLRHGQVTWSRPWSTKEIMAARRHDALSDDRHHGKRGRIAGRVAQIWRLLRGRPDR